LAQRQFIEHRMLSLQTYLGSWMKSAHSDIVCHAITTRPSASVVRHINACRKVIAWMLPASNDDVQVVSEAWPNNLFIF